MKKTILLLLALALLCTAACSKSPIDPTTTVEQEKTTMSKKQTIELPELCDALEWCNKTPAELGRSSDADIELQGKLFGVPAHGSVFFLNRSDPRVHSVYLYVNTADLAFDDCRAALAQRYEETEDGMEPYAVANGGVVTWVRFRLPSGTLLLSKGEAHTWYSLEAIRA